MKAQFSKLYLKYRIVIIIEKNKEAMVNRTWIWSVEAETGSRKRKRKRKRKRGF